jgi:plasmid segregation protein ParM
VAYYQRHRERLAELLRGQHDVRLVNASGSREDTVFAVQQVRVVPQPFGSLFEAIFADSGELAAGHLAREKVGVIDVGFRTADYTIADRTRYSARGSGTSEAGMSRAFAIVAARLKDLTGVDVELYRLYDAMDRGSIKIRGKEIDLREMRDEVYTRLAGTIATEVERLWHDDWDMDRILVTGGGGRALAPYLQGRIEGEVQSVDTSKDTRQNNARGYWKYGRHLWSRAAARPRAAEA